MGFLKFKKNTLIRITKELIGMQRPTNAPYLAKLAMSKAASEKLDVVFSGFDNVIVLPAKIKEANKYDGKKLFQIKYKNFDENSLCVVVKYVSLNCLKEVANDILNQFRIDEVLIRFGNEVYLYQRED